MMIPGSKKTGLISRFLSGAAAAAIFGGCSLGSALPPQAPTPIVAGQAIRVPLEPSIVRAAVNRTWSEAVPKRPPLDVEVAQAFFQEDELKIKVHVTAKRELKGDDLVLAVSGLREGDVLEEQVLGLNDVITAPSLEAGQKAAFLFTLTSDALTEYQVRASWGADARRVTANRNEIRKLEDQLKNARASLGTHAPALEPPAEVRPEKPLTLENMTINEVPEECEVKPCNVNYFVEAELANHTNAPATGVALALGLYWVTEGSLPIVPGPGAPLGPNEEKIDLESLELPPLTAKSIRVKVDRSVPVVPGGRFLPHLRILTAPRS